MCRTFTLNLSWAKIRHDFHMLAHFIPTAHFESKKWSANFHAAPIRKEIAQKWESQEQSAQWQMDSIKLRSQPGCHICQALITDSIADLITMVDRPSS